MDSLLVVTCLSAWNRNSPTIAFKPGLVGELWRG